MTPTPTIADLLGRYDAVGTLLSAAVKERFPFGSAVILPLPPDGPGATGRVIGFLPKDPTVVAVDVTPGEGTSRTVYLPVALLLEANPLPVRHEQAEQGDTN